MAMAEQKLNELKEECETQLKDFNTHFKTHFYVRKLDEDETIQRLENLLHYCKRLNVLFICYWNVYKCVPEETWKMYENLELTGLLEQEQLKYAKDKIDEFLRVKPKLLVKGKVSNARKTTIRYITERNPVQPE